MHDRLKHFFVVLIVCFSCGLRASDPLSPGAPVQVTTLGDIRKPPVVAGTGDGFMVASVHENNLYTSFSSNKGTTWSVPSPLYTNAYFPMWVAGRKTGSTSGFMATWIGPDIGYVTENPIWAYSSNNGATWSSVGNGEITNASHYVASPVVIMATTLGFMAVWHNTQDHNAYASITTDNGASWSTPVNISGSGQVTSAVMVSYNPNHPEQCRAVWVENDGFNNLGCSAATDNFGASWGAASQIDVIYAIGNEICIAGSPDGFLVSWATADLWGNCAFLSNDGGGWEGGTLAYIARPLGQTNISITHADAGFVAVWIDMDTSNVYASFSADNGATWSGRVAVVSDGSVSVGDITAGANNSAFVSAAAVGNDCMFTWLGGDGNVYASYTRVGGALINPPSSLVGVQCKNSFGLISEYYNKMNWSLSDSDGVTGYLISRNGDALVTLGPTATTFEDHNQQGEGTINYTLIAFDDAGNQSEAVTYRFSNGIVSVS